MERMMMMMMRYYGNTWVAMLMLITNVPMYVNKEVWGKKAGRNESGSLVDQ